MNTRYEDDTDLHDLHEPQRDREISLGAATILGIFFVLALICAVFFGFGYTLGRRSSQQQPAAISSEPNPTLSSNGSKPSPGSAASTPAPSKNTLDDASPTPETLAQQLPIPTGTHTVALESNPTTPAPKPVVTPAVVLKPTPPPIPTVALSTPGSVLVQVAAVSHQEDADTLFAALKKRGYVVTVRHEPQDKLLHIQIGPFATKKDAEAMRQRLLSDGYNAIVK